MATLVGGPTPDPAVSREIVKLWDSTGIIYEGGLGYPDRIAVRDPVGVVYGKDIDWEGHRIETPLWVWYIPKGASVSTIGVPSPPVLGGIGGSVIGGVAGYFLGEPLGPMVSEVVGAVLGGGLGGGVGLLIGLGIIPVPQILSLGAAPEGPGAPARLGKYQITG